MSAHAGNVNNDPGLIEPIALGVDQPEAGTERRGDSQLFVNGTNVTSPETERPSLVQRGFSASHAPFDDLHGFCKSSKKS